MIKILKAALLILILFFNVNLFAETGKQSPSLSTIKWISGESCDPSKPDGKNIYIVELWATWCTPCKESMSHLNNLYDKYKGKNLIIIGITNETEDVVTKFLKINNIKYNIGLDSNSEVSTAFMHNNFSIPQAFIIDSAGLILWEGHPMEIEKPLIQVVNGTFSLENSKELNELKTELGLAYQQGRAEDVLNILNKLIIIEPENIDNYQFKVYMLKKLDRYNELAVVYSAWEKAAGNSYFALHIITKSILQETNLAVKDIEMALRCAEKAVELSQKKDTEVLYTLAEAYSAIGLFDKTIEINNEAMKIANPGEVEYIKTAIEYYNRMIILRNKIINSGAVNH